MHFACYWSYFQDIYLNDISLFFNGIFLFMMFYSIISVRRAILRSAILATYALAIFFVWNPSQTTVFANYFGIGRGLDFVLVLFFVAMLNGTFFIVKHLSFQQRNISKFTRHIAILDARKPRSFVKAASTLTK